MSQPWFPSPNPGGNDRTLMRTALKSHIDAQRIRGLNYLYPSKPAQWLFDLYQQDGTDFACLAAIKIGDDSEDRYAYTGPTDPGGKLVHYQVTVEIVHRTYTLDEAQPDNGQPSGSEDDYDRIVGALKDCLRGTGRDLGRPDVILTVGEYPRVGGIRHKVNDPVMSNGVLVRNGFLYFQITQYLVKYP